MARSTGVLALLAVVASAWCAIAQNHRADKASRARMAEYFANVPVGGSIDGSSSAPGGVTAYQPSRVESRGVRISYAAAPSDRGSSKEKPSSPGTPAGSAKPGERMRLPTGIDEEPPPKDDGGMPSAQPPSRLEEEEKQPGVSRERPTAPPTPLPAVKPPTKPRKLPPLSEIPAPGPPAREPAPPKAPATKAPAAKRPAAKRPAAKTPGGEPPTRLPKTETQSPKAPAAPLPPDSAYEGAPAAPQAPRHPRLPKEPRRVEPVPEETQEGECWASDEFCPTGETCCCPCRPSCTQAPLARLVDPIGGPLGIRARGWVDQGVTVNTFSPRDRSNRPVVFNDRSNDYQLNQLYLVVDRPIDRDAPCWQIGGQVDLLYGTDHVYTAARGLELFRDGAAKWNSDNGPVGTNYGLSMPQLYMEVFAPWANGLSLKLGHFYTITGYEVAQAPDNFFYSHAYTFQYGEPFTHTGLLAEYAISDRLKLRAGLTRGWDTWEDNNNDLSFLGGLVWTSPSQRTSLALSVYTGPDADEPPEQGSFRTVYSLVLEHQCTDRLTYVLQHDWGYEPRATAANRPGNWYGVNQYLIYRINPIWAAALRFEWFQDKGGTRVLGTSLDPQRAHFFELTAGLNWSPRQRLTVRPEIRWDWATDCAVDPFADATRDYQLLLAVDAIVEF